VIGDRREGLHGGANTCYVEWFGSNGPDKKRSAQLEVVLSKMLTFLLGVTSMDCIRNEYIGL